MVTQRIFCGLDHHSCIHAHNLFCKQVYNLIITSNGHHCYLGYDRKMSFVATVLLKYNYAVKAASTCVVKMKWIKSLIKETTGKKQIKTKAADDDYLLILDLSVTERKHSSQISRDSTSAQSRTNWSAAFKMALLFPRGRQMPICRRLLAISSSFTCCYQSRFLWLVIIFKARFCLPRSRSGALLNHCFSTISISLLVASSVSEFYLTASTQT